MEDRAVTIQTIARVLNMSVNEVEELCENRKIPFHITDEGTAWEAKRFFANEVLKAVKPVKKEEPVEEKAEKEPVKEPVKEPEKEPEKEPVKEPVKEPAKKEVVKEEVEKESSKKAKTKSEDPL